METLNKKHCLACEGGVSPLTHDQVQSLLQNIPQWKLKTDGKEIFRYFQFKNFYEVMAFVNAIAWMAHQENHHPDLEIGYDYCQIRYSTHAIGGLSDNDFICAAKVDALLFDTPKVI